MEYRDGENLPRGKASLNIVDPTRLLENMRIVQKMHGQKIPQTITEPFRTSARLFCTLSKLDHYQLMRRDAVIVPPSATGTARTPYGFAGRLLIVHVKIRHLCVVSGRWVEAKKRHVEGELK